MLNALSFPVLTVDSQERAFEFKELFKVVNNVVTVLQKFELMFLIEAAKQPIPFLLRLLSDIKNMPGNDVCADCTSREPVWASINLGTFLLISGVFQNLTSVFTKGFCAGRFTRCH